MRLDQYIVLKGWATSRTKAQEMIERGEVHVHIGERKILAKASLEVDEASMHIDVQSQLEKYVSRAGFKLEKALQHLNLSVNGFKVLDIGISTGGFTDCLLQHGASEIVGIDVGRGQLHPKISADQRVRQFEETNAKDILHNPEIQKIISDRVFDLIVIDVSFISMGKILSSLTDLLNKNGRILALFKPQFEVGPKNLDRNGVVINIDAIQVSSEALVEKLKLWNLQKIEFFESGFPGRDGNKEYFIFMAPLS